MSDSTTQLPKARLGEKQKNMRLPLSLHKEMVKLTGNLKAQHGSNVSMSQALEVLLRKYQAK